MTPTLLGNPDINVPNITAQNWGDPLSKILDGDSMGKGSGTGIGNGQWQRPRPRRRIQHRRRLSRTQERAAMAARRACIARSLNSPMKR